MKHRKFTDVFKRDAVRQASVRGANKAAVAKSLDISSNILHRWIREAKAGGQMSAVRGTAKPVEAVMLSAAPSTAPAQARASSGEENLMAELNAVNAERQLLKEALSFYLEAAA